MQVRVEARDPAQAAAELLAVPLAAIERAKWRLPSRLAGLDRALSGQLRTRISSGDFRGKSGERLLLFPSGNAGPRRVLLVGLGDAKKADADALRRAAGIAVAEAGRRGGGRLAVVATPVAGVETPAAAQALAEGAVLAGYRFVDYRTKVDDPPAAIRSLTLVLERATDARAARDGARVGVCVAESENLARQLSNEPPNVLTPAALARQAARVAKASGFRCRILDVPDLRRQKMGALLAVGLGSSNAPRLIVLEHGAAPRSRGRGKRRSARRPTICLVGKGVTFDSGGISIKPSASMDEMKHDMSGAAAVVGALRAAALLKLPLHVAGVIAAAENLPSGSAYRPGDIVTAMSGKTIEVLNTDAEGRVILADALHFACKQFEPQAIIDLATLTGACVVSLGKWASGLFGNDEQLIERVRRAGEVTGERAWPMPLWDGHREQVRSEVADVKNTSGRDAGASTAAAFLAQFVGETPWVHLDIAGTAWTDKPGAYQPRGATGVGVRLLVELLRSWNDGAGD